MYRIVYDYEGERFNLEFPSEHALDVYMDTLPADANIVQVVLNGRL